MIFRDSIAWLGLSALLVPIAIHLLVRAPARPIVLASLRFVTVSPMRALRRRVLNDGGLLALRLAILLVAVAAFADPLATSSCRRTAWNARTVRAVVADPRVDPAAVARARNEPAAFATTTIASDDLESGLLRALVWLDAAPAARHEVVFVSPLTLGALDDTVLRAAPASTGLRFVRAAAPASPAPIGSPRVSASDPQERLLARSPQLTFEGDEIVDATGATTRLADRPIEPAAHGWIAPLLGIRVAGPDPVRADLRAALVAAMTVGVAIGATPARPIVVLADTNGDVASYAPPVEAVAQAWMAEAAARLATDPEVVRELRGTKVMAGVDPGGPWRTVLRDAEGRAVASVAAGPPGSAAGTSGSNEATLVVRVRADAASPLLAAIIRRLLVSDTATRAFERADVLPIPEGRLMQWSRPAGEVDQRVGVRHESDRAWLWAAVLAAVGAETLLRRRTTSRAMSRRESGSHDRAA